MGVLEALVLLSLGLLCGIIATMCDVLLVGAASFLSHFALWVLLNTLLATHLESRSKAIWWSIPFNLGFIESYFITTVASYESFPKSLMVPLAAVALLSPLLTNALWQAKHSKDAFGKALSCLLVGCTLVASYVINGALSVFDFVACALIALELLVVPTRKLSIKPSRQRESQREVRRVDEDSAADDWVPATRARRADEPEQQNAEQGEQPAEDQRRAPRPTKRTGNGIASRVMSLSSRRRRAAKAEAEDERARTERTRETRRRNWREEREEPAFEGESVSTLGNARSARPTSRSRR